MTERARAAAACGDPGGRDVVGHSRLMGENEAGTLAQLKDCRTSVIDPSFAPL